MPQSNDHTWDNDILSLFNVLIGLAFAQITKQLSDSGYALLDVLLSCVVIFIILDSWYLLRQDLTIIDITTWPEAMLSVLSLAVYACLPFLYGISSDPGAAQFERAEWLLLCLVAYCAVDALRMIFHLIGRRAQHHNGVTRAEQVLIGSYVFYAITGVLYTPILALLVFVSVESGASPLLKAIAVSTLWLSIRLLDHLAIPKVSTYLSQLVITDGPANGDSE